MPVNHYIKLNGFEFTLTTLNVDSEVILRIGDEKISKAILGQDPNFLSALAQLTNDYHEIHSVLMAYESLSMWLQIFDGNHKSGLHQILNSQ